MANQDLLRTNIQTPSNDSIHKGSLDTCHLKTCIYMYDSGEEILFCDLNLSTPSLCIRISIFHDKVRRAFLSQRFDSKDPNSLWTCKRSLILPASTRFGMLPRCRRIFSTNLDILALLILAHRTSDDEIGPFNARYWMVCIGSQKGAVFLSRLSARLHKGVLWLVGVHATIQAIWNIPPGRHGAIHEPFPRFFRSRTLDSWFRNPASRVRMVVSLHNFTRFLYIPGGWEWDFWTINNIPWKSIVGRRNSKFPVDKVPFGKKNIRSFSGTKIVYLVSLVPSRELTYPTLGKGK